MKTPLRQIPNLRQNQLLAALPASDRDRLAPQLELVHLERGQILCESGAVPRHVYFPISSIVSLLHITQSGGTSEIAVVGNEGVVGMSLFSTGEAARELTKVQTAGDSYRFGARFAKEEIGRSGMVLVTLFNYAHTLMAQMAQTAVYTRHHSLEQQLCRRLLLALDRLPSDEMQMTHEVMGDLLGVRRESVTNIALRLQQAGVIRYSRGRIAVLDRQRLEQRACGSFPQIDNVLRASHEMQCAA
jgi:CRP-like cAMP-binding protein